MSRVLFTGSRCESVIAVMATATVFRTARLVSFRLGRRLLLSLERHETPQAGSPARNYELHICHSTIIASSLALKGPFS